MTNAKRSTKKSSKPLTLNMETSVVSGEDNDLSALLSGLGLPDAPPADEEVVVAETHPAELELEAAVAAAETAEISIANASEEIIEGTPPTASTEDAAAKKKADAAAAKAAAKAERERVAAEKKATKDAEKAKKAVERAEKKAKRDAEKAARPTRKYYASKVERVTDKLGASLGDYTVLTLSDAALTGDELAAKQKETLEVLSGAGKKVQNRMTLLLEFVAGKSTKLNEVIARAFALLKKDGHIKTGDKGNFHADLLAKPYSPQAARAMGNNTVAALRDFKVIQKNADGLYVANPESLILMKVNGMLGLA